MPVFDSEATPNGDQNFSPRESCDLPALLSSNCHPITLKFIDVGYKVNIQNNSKSGIRGLINSCFNKESNNEFQEKTILQGVTGMASPGEIVAILGPSGSGKSTLLNALAGRLQGHNLTGTIQANNQNLSKQVLRLTGFVTQDEVLYPNLTVRETLIYCSLLRLPKGVTKKEKVAIADSVISELGLQKCENTVIGNTFIHGVSGGERKRVSIGHEMLMNPSLLILDEPTSGLDSTAAYRLVSMLQSLAHKGKTVVTSMHQPSSRIYQTFDSVVLLSEGRCLYFGKGSDAVKYFESIGFSPSFPMNPADFLLDLANGVYQVEGVSERDKVNLKETLIDSYNAILAPKVNAACLDTPNLPGDVPSNERINGSIALSTWFTQFSILIQRGLKERRHETFNTLRVFQVLAAAILSGVMWWHSEFQDIQDRLGLLYFFSIFWGVFSSFNAVFAFPQERAIFVKERASGMYTLSSYFFARIVGDVPMDLILPTVFLTVTYWMAGLKPDIGAFLLTLAVLLFYVLVSQGLGFAFGAAIMEAKQATTIVTVTMLLFVLTGGYYVHKVPSCLAWIKYICYTFYSYRLFIDIQYGNGERIATLLGCYHRGPKNSSCKFVEQDVVGQMRPETSVGILLIMFVGYRILAYIALRRTKV